MSTPPPARRRSRSRSAGPARTSRDAATRTTAIIIGVVTVAVATWAAAFPKADHITAWVVELVSTVPADQALLPFWQPAPMNSWGFRPLSILLMKAYEAVSSGASPPPALIAAKTALGSLAFASGAAAWLRAHGMGRAALPAAVGALMLAPHLFSCWYLTELDHLVAAALLAGLAALRLGRGWPDYLLASAGIGAAILLKESGALVCFAFLAASASVAAMRGSRDVAVRHAIALVVSAAPWLTLSLAMMGAATSEVGRAPLVERLPLIEHNLVQVGYLATSAGAVLVAVGAAAGLHRRGARAGTVGALGLLVALPLLTVYSHYETVYHHVRWGGTLVAVVLLVGLIVVAMDRRQPIGRATAAATVVAMVAAVDVAVLASSAPREDLAARLFLPAAPLLLALAIEGLRTAWHRADQVWERGAVGVLGAALVWGPVAHLVNTVGEWTARQPVELAGRQILAGTQLREAPVAFNHFAHWVGPEEQAQLAGQPTGAARYVPLPAWLNEPRLPGDRYTWTRGDKSLAGTIENGDPVYVFWQASRAQVSPEAGAVLLGDLSWTRRPLGVLSSGRVMEEPADVVGDHNMVEDLQRTTFSPGPTPLERRLERDGERLYDGRQRYSLVPLNLLDLPRRLAQGVPWRVPMDAEVVVWRVPGRSP